MEALTEMRGSISGSRCTEIAFWLVRNGYCEVWLRIVFWRAALRKSPSDTSRWLNDVKNTLSLLFRLLPNLDPFDFRSAVWFRNTVRLETEVLSCIYELFRFLLAMLLELPPPEVSFVLSLADLYSSNWPPGWNPGVCYNFKDRLINDPISLFSP